MPLGFQSRFHDACVFLKSAMLVLIVVLGTWGQGAVAEGGPSKEEIEAVRTQLQAARKALSEHGERLNEDDRRLVAAKLSEAEAAFRHFEEVVGRGEGRRAATAPLVMAGGALIVDDASGIGAADDVLLPIVVLGLLATRFMTEPPATSLELQQAWLMTLLAMQVVAQAGTNAKSQVQVSSPSKRDTSCSCACFKKGVGPYLLEQMPSPEACWRECKARGYGGYRCGGGKVLWP